MVWQPADMTLYHRMKLLFSFLLGAAVFSMVLLQARQCSTGTSCIGISPESYSHFRTLFSFFQSSAINTSGSAAINMSGFPTVQPISSPVRTVLENRLFHSTPSVSLSPPQSLSFTESHKLISQTEYSIPPLKYGQQTFPRPPGGTQHFSMSNRTDKSACVSGSGSEYCQQYLSPQEKTAFSKCYTNCRQQSRKFGPVVNGTCHFMNGRDRLPVALASFPGSGNTWTRGLLETITGICTGGLYCDCGLRSGGFTGEGVQGSSVLVMKTHHLKVQFVEGHVFSRERLPYGATVLLVRDPRAALVAEWNREKTKRQVSYNVSNHFAYVGQEYFGANKDWDAYIHAILSRWPQQTVNLLFEAKLAKCPVYILVFEDLKSDTAGEMKRVTDFLGFSYTLEEVSARLKEGYSHFYRNHTAHFPHFTPDQEQYIHSVVKATSQFMKKEDLYSMFPRIDDYL